MNRLVSFEARDSDRRVTKANSARMIRQTQAEFLAGTAMTKSVCASGSCALTVPSPGPRPNSEPFMNASSAVLTW